MRALQPAACCIELRWDQKENLEENGFVRKSRGSTQL